MVKTDSRKTDKAEIEQLIEEFGQAMAAKDVKKMLSFYAADVIVFDVKPPFQTRGAVAWRHTWEACIPFFPESFKVERRDLKIFAGAEVAVAHYLFRLTGPDKKHDAMQTWMRATTAFSKQQGKWKIVHDHASLPFNPHTAQAIFTLDVD